MARTWMRPAFMAGGAVALAGAGLAACALAGVGGAGRIGPSR